jgi:hypothetical protein
VHGWRRVIFLEAQSDRFGVHDVGVVREADGRDAILYRIERGLVWFDAVLLEFECLLCRR